MGRSELNTGSKLLSLGDLAGLFNGYLVLTDDLEIAGVSEPFAASLGHAVNDLVGVSAEKIVDEQTLSRLRSNLPESLKEGQTGRIKLTMFDRSRRSLSRAMATLRVYDADRGYLLLLDEESAASPGKRPRSPKRNQSNADLRSLSTIEGIHIRKVLSATGGNRTKASEILGISRVTLLAKIKQFGQRSDA